MRGRRGVKEREKESREEGGGEWPAQGSGDGRSSIWKWGKRRRKGRREKLGGAYK